MTVGIIMDVATKAGGVVGVPQTFPFADAGLVVTLSVFPTTGIVTYLWEILDQDENASAVLSDAASATPTFTMTALVSGTYSARCTINGGTDFGDNAVAILTQDLGIRKPAAGEKTIYSATEGWKSALNRGIDKWDHKPSRLPVSNLGLQADVSFTAEVNRSHKFVVSGNNTETFTMPDNPVPGDRVEFLAIGGQDPSGTIRFVLGVGVSNFATVVSSSFITNWDVRPHRGQLIRWEFKDNPSRWYLDDSSLTGLRGLVNSQGVPEDSPIIGFDSSGLISAFQSNEALHALYSNQTVGRLADTSTGTQNEWLSGQASAFAAASYVVWAGTSPVVINGITNDDTDSGWSPLKYIFNASIANTMYFIDGDPAATNTDRLFTPNRIPFPLKPGSGAIFWYDRDQSGGRWMIVATQDPETLRYGAAALSSNQNDWVPGSADIWTQSNTIRVDCTSAADITGLIAPEAAADLTMIRRTFVNEGTASVTFLNDSGSSSAANRIWNKAAASVVLLADQGSVSYIYDPVDTKWRED